MQMDSVSYATETTVSRFERPTGAETDTVLERLQSACDEFLHIARRTPVSPLQLLHMTAAGLHMLAAAIADCEAASVERRSIVPFLGPVHAIHARSPFVHRLQTWPRGYPGDFETVEWMCDAKNHAVEGTVGWAVEQYALHSAIAQQHRNKVALQARAILTTVQARADARVASIGCGGCRDLSLIQSYIPAGNGRFVVVDSDAAALEFSLGRLDRLSDRLRTVHGRVPRVLPSLASDGPFNLIVAGGLFDYLPDRWAILALRETRKLLAPQGRLFFSNIAAGNPFRPWLEYLVDWTLIERRESDLVRLVDAAGFAGSKTTISRDSTGLALIADVLSP